MSDVLYSRFRALLREVEQVFAAESGGAAPPIEQWKGELIQSFQESLREKAGGTISEKWFYTHVKNSHDKLPRVDTLNLLCSYAGHRDWSSYSLGQENRKTISGKKLWVPISLVVVLVLSFVVVQFWGGFETPVSHRVCLVDGDLGHGVDGSKVRVELLREGQSSEYISCDAQGCFELKEEGEVTFVIHAPYYKKDTVRRVVMGMANEQVSLHTDDYALMIRVISSNDIKDWKRRRAQLDQMIADEASIVFVAPGDNRMLEIFTKDEFISKLTTPTRTLNDLEIISAQYQDDRIVHLRYTINPENPEAQ